MNPIDSPQRTWGDAREGDSIGPLSFPLPLIRLVLAAAGTRDYTPIHHNADFAKTTGAPDAYAGVFFLQGMWERAAREYLGSQGRILKMGSFRMRSFNAVGDVVVVEGQVTRKWSDKEIGYLEIEMTSSNNGGISVGPGVILASLPLSSKSDFSKQQT